MKPEQKNVVYEDKETERFHKLLSIIFYICDMAGFHLEERLVVKDMKTGKIWK